MFIFLLGPSMGLDADVTLMLSIVEGIVESIVLSVIGDRYVNPAKAG